MKNAFFLFILINIISSHFLFAQVKTKAGEGLKNDPNATAFLGNIQKKYNSLSSIELGFSLSTEVPSKPKATQKGTFIQKKENYLVRLPDYELFCNGKTVWVYRKDKNEVQINDNDAAENKGDGDLLSPKDLLKVYQWKDFSHYISGESKDKQGNPTYEIDLVPLKKQSDYFKVKLTATKKTFEIKSIKVFYKDGVRQTFDVLTMATNKNYNSSTFLFDAKKYPKVRVEDLRID